MGATAGSYKAQSASLIFDHILEHLGPYNGDNAANVAFQVAYANGIWFIGVDQWLHITPQKFTNGV